MRCCMLLYADSMSSAHAISLLVHTDLHNEQHACKHVLPLLLFHNKTMIKNVCLHHTQGTHGSGLSVSCKSSSQTAPQLPRSMETWRDQPQPYPKNRSGVKCLLSSMCLQRAIGLVLSFHLHT